MSASTTRASTEVSRTPATASDGRTTGAAFTGPAAVFRVRVKSPATTLTPARSASARLRVTTLAPVSTSIRMGRPATTASAQ
ncbi:hypothetical protein D3C86_1830430 [compost metagenome]